MRHLTLLLAISLAVLPPAGALAHDDPAHELVELSERIEREPDSAALRLERAELNRVRGDWAAGLADLQDASRLDPSMAAVDLALAGLLLDAGNLPAARDAADRFVARRPDHVNGHLVRARILLRAGDRLDAAAAFTRAIDLDRTRRGDTSGVQPDDFLARARALAEAGRIDEAVDGLDEGLALLGGAITLQLLAIELDEARGNIEGALARVAAIEARAKRKEAWMARRGDLLAASGRRDEAERAYQGALEAIAALPPRARGAAATAGLQASIRDRLASSPAPEAERAAAKPEGGAQ